ncbi:MAG TPA: PAS-domain containing protein, partial [Paracoccus sp. (in: a-proteobacteria)]|nr:PAS-domain containing protein [Paracoccus sp. (in: a-proteobacteria)]
LDRARQLGRAECTGARGLGAATLRLVAEDLGDGLLRLQISDPAAENAGIVVDSQSLAAMEEELAILRDAVDHNPVLIWREGLDGRVAWANAAYLREVEARSGDEILWPMPRLIDLAEQDEQAVLRARIDSEDRTQWFDCHVQPAADGRTIHAVPADSAVRAERSLREFVQTLTKTFADLPIGLAIFDRERRLQLFNPALIDLTGLATGFLTARPTLYAVLDTLRESRMVPEPKDYRSWRNMMATLEAAAATGHHVETWSLPGGQTYRVTGRPHPDGAIAFLFEDITAEMAMTRRFRAELSLGAEILDAVDEAVAIFDAGGRLLSVNRAYGALWGMDQPAGLRGHLELWHNGSARAAGPDALREALAGDLGSRIPQGTITAPDGTSLPWRVRALSGGRRMVLFGEGRPPSAAVGATPHRAEPSMRASAASTPAEWLEPAGVI